MYFSRLIRNNLLFLVKKGDKEVHFSNSDTSSCSSFFDLVSEALNSTKSKPNSLQTRDTVVVLPEIFFQMKNEQKWNVVSRDK